MKKILNNTKKVKGFTLVELIVVISIIGVLAAILVPNIMAYYKKARMTAAIADAKIIVSGIQTTLMDKALTYDLSVKKSTTMNGVKTNVGGLSNTALYNCTQKSYSTNSYDIAIAKSVLDILSNADMVIASDDKPFGKTGSEIVGKKNGKKTTNIAILAIYTSDGSVPFVQIYRKGILVTYAYGQYIANDSAKAKFINYNQSFFEPFKDVGMSKDEVDSAIVNSMTPSSSEWQKG